MDRAPNEHQLAERLPDRAEALASVHLTRFTVQSEHRAELVRLARSTARPAAVLARSDWQLLVELEDGDWLEISITGPGEGSDDMSSYLDLADGIVGDEDGTIVGCARAETSGTARREGPH